MVNALGEHATATLADEVMGAGGGDSGGGDMNQIGPDRTDWLPNKTYPKLFHLFFLQARCVKIEA